MLLELWAAIMLSFLCLYPWQDQSVKVEESDLETVMAETKT